MPESVHPLTKNSPRKSKFSYCAPERSHAWYPALSCTTMAPPSTEKAASGPSCTLQPASDRPSKRRENPLSPAVCGAAHSSGAALAPVRKVRRFMPTSPWRFMRISHTSETCIKRPLPLSSGFGCHSRNRPPPAMAAAGIQRDEMSGNNGGEGGIRTPGRSFPLRRFSKPLLSTTQPPLREMKYGPKKHPTTSTAEDYQSERATLTRISHRVCPGSRGRGSTRIYSGEAQKRHTRP